MEPIVNRVLFLILFCVNVVFSNDNVVKTSQLELFLFKIGFQSLLKDVELTKDRSKLNEDELLTLNNKIDLIMDELYKSKRVLQSDKKEVVIKGESYKNEIKSLRLEIDFLKEEIKKLSIGTHKSSKIDKNHRMLTARVVVDELNVKIKPYHKATALYTLKRNNIISIEYCDSFDWCKIENENAFIPKYLLKF